MVARWRSQSPGHAKNLPERFFSQARRVLLQEANTLDFEPADILSIAQDRAMREDFRNRFRRAGGDGNGHNPDEIEQPKAKSAAKRLRGFIADPGTTNEQL